MEIKKSLSFLLVAFFAASSAQADITVPMRLITENGVDKPIGQITLSESKHGLVFTPALSDLPPGLHGFHMHENPSCEPGEKDGKIVAGLAAGGHFDPLNTKQHGPWGEGHLGDLPALYADGKGGVGQAQLAPRLKLSDVVGRSLVIHEKGDNYSDQPLPLGGGGARIACGVIPKNKGK
jgi:superoxide dismutase, Cu-Zn family